MAKYKKNDSKRAARKKAYASYLNGKKWKQFRSEAIEYYGNRCGICGSIYSLQVHHKHYRNRFNEKLEDVMVLCNSCHYRAHPRKKTNIDRETVTYYVK